MKQKHLFVATYNRTYPSKAKTPDGAKRYMTCYSLNGSPEAKQAYKELKQRQIDEQNATSGLAPLPSYYEEDASGNPLWHSFKECLFLQTIAILGDEGVFEDTEHEDRTDRIINSKPAGALKEAMIKIRAEQLTGPPRPQHIGVPALLQQLLALTKHTPAVAVAQTPAEALAQIQLEAVELTDLPLGSE